jgi:ribosomal peptide maturation radical SAM protein 1
MRVLLVNMPWAALEVPSLALGILRRKAADVVGPKLVDVLHANLGYVDWVAERTGLGVDDYSHVAQTTYFLGVGDWIFSSALYDDPHWREAEFRQHRERVLSPERMEQALMLHRAAPDFVRELAERIVVRRPAVVGFTSTFQQNTASLALARQVKRLMPDVVTVFGGANCDGAQGEALHRNFPFVDVVCRGEGEAAFPALLAALGEPATAPSGELGTATGPVTLAAIPGLCWRDADGRSVVNAMAERPLPPAQLVGPDYSDYFAQLTSAKVGAAVEPKLVVEGARGCWWGAMHHCTFCGLNGSSMEFRSKPPRRYLAELLDLVARHQTLDVFVVDNILDMDYLISFLPMLADADLDLRMQVEIKSNLRADLLEVLRRAGVSTVQPGIESLSSRVLKIMRKGVTGYQNVRMLRDAESVGLSVAWNYLYGFPGELPEDYGDIVAQVPALHHLYPPEWSGRIALERFSPYFEDPRLGFPVRRPDPQYDVTYDLPTSELNDLAYLFQAPQRGIDEPTAARLDDAVRHWQQRYTRSRFCYYAHGDTITLVNDRAEFAWSALTLVDPVETAAFHALEQPRTAASLAREVEGRTGGQFGTEQAADLLRAWRDLGIVFEEGGRFIRLPTTGDNQALFHLECDSQYLGGNPL